MFYSYSGGAAAAVDGDGERPRGRRRKGDNGGRAWRTRLSLVRRRRWRAAAELILYDAAATVLASARPPMPRRARKRTNTSARAVRRQLCTRVLLRLGFVGAARPFKNRYFCRRQKQSDDTRVARAGADETSPRRAQSCKILLRHVCYSRRACVYACVRASVLCLCVGVGVGVTITQPSCLSRGKIKLRCEKATK